MENSLNTIEALYSKGKIKNRIEKLVVNHFRNFEENSIIHFTHPLTVLVGKNGSGKSTLLKVLQAYRNPNEYFIETVLESQELNKSKYEILIDGKSIIYIREGKNNWKISGDIPSSLPIIHIDTKKIVGSFDKSFLYDKIGKHTKRQSQVEYVIKQSKKINQNKLNKSQKKSLIQLNKEQIDAINNILGRSYQSISILNHRYFNGSWGTTILFEDNKNYSEYNSGSGEFSLVMLVWQVATAPNNGLILIDEPEIALHPGSQRRLLQWILKIIIKKKLQVVLSTHSPFIIEDLPTESIKCISNTFNKKSIIQENVIYTEAFYDLEISNPNLISIIVEDSLAKKILDAILKNEGYSNTFVVQYTSGGADYIKTQLIPILSKMQLHNIFILFDGDQLTNTSLDLDEVAEKHKTLEFLKGKFKEITNVKPSSINWGIDGNKKQNNSNQEQLQQYLIYYLSYYHTRVNFFPLEIPEDIIWDLEYAKILHGNIEDNLFNDCKDSKGKFWKLSILMDVNMESLYSMFISNYVREKQQSSTYQSIVSIINNWLNKDK